MLADEEEPVQTAWVDRWVDIEPRQIPIVTRWVDIVQVAPAPMIEPEPMVTLRGVGMVIITIALTLAIVPRRFNYVFNLEQAVLGGDSPYFPGRAISDALDLNSATAAAATGEGLAITEGAYRTS